MAEEYLDQKPVARDLYGREVGNKEVSKSFGSAAGGDMSLIVQTTKLFSELQGGELRRPTEGEVKPKDNTSQPTQTTYKDVEVTLHHHEGP